MKAAGKNSFTKAGNNVSDYDSVYRNSIVNFTRLDSHLNKTLEALKSQKNTLESEWRKASANLVDKLEQEITFGENNINQARDKTLRALQEEKDESEKKLSEMVPDYKKKAQEFLDTAGADLISTEEAINQVKLNALITPAKHSHNDDGADTVPDESLIDSSVKELGELSESVRKRKNRVQESTKKLQEFRIRRSRNRKNLFFVAIVIICTSLSFGVVFHTERKIEKAIASALKALEAKDWDNVLIVVSDLIDQTVFGDNLFKKHKVITPFWQIIGVDIMGYPTLDKSYSDLMSFTGEVYYRKGLSAFSEKNWSEVVVNFKEMKKLDKYHLQRFPVTNVSWKELQDNKANRKTYLKYKKKYQVKRGLTDDFYYITPLLQTSLFNAGKEEYEKKHWAEAAKLFDQVPGYGKSKIVRKNRYELAIEKLKNGKLKTAYKLFYQLRNENSDARKKMVEILIKERKKIIVKGSDLDSGRFSKMILRFLKIDKVRGEKMSLTFYFKVQIIRGSKATIMKPSKVTLATGKKNYRAVYKDGFFSKKQYVQTARARTFSVNFSKISLSDIGKRFTFRYGKFYTIHFYLKLSEKI